MSGMIHKKSLLAGSSGKENGVGNRNEMGGRLIFHCISSLLVEFLKPCIYLTFSKRKTLKFFLVIYVNVTFVTSLFFVVLLQVCKLKKRIILHYQGKHQSNWVNPKERPAPMVG